jgi:hypothetical protein
MSVYKNPPDGITERRNKIGSNQWCARPLELLESPAYKVLSRAAHQVMSRIEIELRHHGGRNPASCPSPSTTSSSMASTGTPSHQQSAN